MMFIPIPGLGSLMKMAGDALGSVGSMVAKQLVKIPGGQKIINGANWVMKKARSFSTKGQNAYKNITGAVKDFFDVTGDFVKGKVGAGPEMSFGEAVSEYTGRVRTRYQKLRDESRVGSIVETPQEEAKREASEAVGATETQIKPGEQIEESKVGEGKAREMTLDRLTAEPMAEQNEAIRKALEGLDPREVSKPKQKSLLSDIEIPTTKDMRAETDEAIQQAIDLGPKESMVGSKVLDYFKSQWDTGIERVQQNIVDAPINMAENLVKAQFMGDDDYGYPSQRGTVSHTYSPQVKLSDDIAFSQMEDDEFIHKTFAIPTADGMYGAGSDYQRRLARHSNILQ